MTLTSGLAIYFIIWWVTLFAVLPFGAHSAHELGEEVEQGHAPSAPVSPRILRKFAITTLVAGIVFACVYVAFIYKLVTLDTFPSF